ncbi:MAG: hypothetical protein KJ808_05920 [Acidobacteria bacterium]|nr:hypothetical protein [Acidobacteriota bacterium]MBU4307050.1 hypothetical protein [Acidobacteriota bacterium]MBU4405790.1 hypothetical protein [Acidobacteriota bacterium]MCG2810255.1 hypothetical protein [Candidatus Aminicenantes bacterium]
MRSKTDDELLRIWMENDREEWSGEAFQAVRELLEKRGLAVPEPKENPDRLDEAQCLPAGPGPKNAARRALIVLHFLYMGGILFYVIPNTGLLYPGAVLILMFVIQVNLFDRARKTLTIICCLLVVLAAVFVLDLLEVMYTFSAAGFEGESLPMLPMFLITLFLVLLEVATIIFATLHFHAKSDMKVGS